MAFELLCELNCMPWIFRRKVKSGHWIHMKILHGHWHIWKVDTGLGKNGHWTLDTGHWTLDTGKFEKLTLDCEPSIPPPVPFYTMLLWDWCRGIQRCMFIPVHICNIYGEEETHHALPLQPDTDHSFCVFSVKFSLDNRDILAGWVLEQCMLIYHSVTHELDPHDFQRNRSRYLPRTWTFPLYRSFPTWTFPLANYPLDSPLGSFPPKD